MSESNRNGHVPRYIDWSPPPPVSLPGMLRIHKNPPGLHHMFISVSSHCVGVWTHWHLDRTIPCSGRTTGCICGVLHLARRWKGYLAAVERTTGFQWLVELSPGAMDRSNIDMGSTGPPLRGRVFVLSRSGDRKGSPIRIGWTSDYVDDAQIPREYDVRDALKRLWGVVEE